MHRYVIKRILMLIPIVIGVSFIVYIIMDMAPGNILSLLIPDDATPEVVARITREYGYDRSVFYRYFDYMKGLVLRGSLGVSYISGADVLQSYISRFPATLLLAACSSLVAVIIAIPLGIYSAKHQGSIQDNVAAGVGLLGMSIPNFWLGLMLMLIFSLKLNWLPSSGYSSPKSVILPAVTVGLVTMATIMRTTRTSMLDVIRQDYIRTARSKGVPERKVINKHALKNAMIPILTVIGTQMAHSIGGSLVTENIFSWPGVGRLVVDAINQRDVPMITGTVIMTTICVSIITLIVDLLYAMIDPRIKVQYIGRRKVKFR